MITHTSTFKEKIKLLGREIKSKIIYYPSYNLISENEDNILTENNLQLISEQANYNDSIEINEENIFSISIIKNGNLFQSLMKEFDFEAKDELNIGSVVNPHFGLLVNENNQTYEFLDYGNYIVYSKEFNMDTETWNYVCYDKMLLSMIKYKPIKNVNFPITIKQYIDLICNKIGLEFEDSNFVNKDELIYEDLYEGKGLTYRDIFDEISKIVAGNLLINDDDKVKVGYPTQTNDTIDEEYLKDINVALGNKIGVINSVAILDTDNNFQYLAEDTVSIKENGMTRITITDNLIVLNGNTQTIADNILNKLNGLYYYINDLTTTGVCYYDFLDLFNVNFNNTTYQCLLLNNEITITQGIEEHIFTEKLEESETNSNEYTTSVMSNKQVQFKINQQEAKIEESVRQDDIIASLNLAIEDGQGIINIRGNQVTIDSDNFKLDADGKIIATSGTIGGFQLGEHLFSSSLISEKTNTYIYTTDDLARVSSIVVGNIIPTEEDYEKYDFTNSRKITSTDFNVVLRLVYGFTTGNATFLLNTQTSEEAIQIIDDNDNIALNLGLYGSYINALASETINTTRLYTDDTTIEGDGKTYAHLGYTNNGSTTGGMLYIQNENGNATIYMDGIAGNITCVSLTQTSKVENKKNFEKLTNAKEILNATDIYKYNFKDEEDSIKKSIGFVIGDNYNYSKEITSTDNNGANVYSMVSVLWQVVKEQQEEIEKIKEMINNGKS